MGLWGPKGQCCSQQYRDEIDKFLELVKQAGYKSAIEIGTGYCGTALLLIEAMGADSIVVSVDLPQEDGGTSYEVEREAKSTVPAGCQYTLVRGNSSDPNTVAAVSKALRGTTADVLFIDAEHTAKAASADLAAYRPLVRRLGMIAFHDICMAELWPMWNSLRGSVGPNRSAEIIHDIRQDVCGIGVIFGNE